MATGIASGRPVLAGAVRDAACAAAGRPVPHALRDVADVDPRCAAAVAARAAAPGAGPAAADAAAVAGAATVADAAIAAAVDRAGSRGHRAAVWCRRWRARAAVPLLIADC